MSVHHEIVRIFVASPSGLDKERQAVSEVIEGINRRNSNHWRLQFKAIGWEDTVGGNRRAQDIINRDLETCDYFIGIMADHWGTPPHPRKIKNPRFTSGFEEEYKLAQSMFKAGDMKDIFLFFKEVSEDKMLDPGSSLKRVLAFRRKVRDERKPFYAEFSNLEAFKDKVEDALSKIGWEGFGSKIDMETPELKDLTNRENLSTSQTESASKEYFLSQDTRDFLQRFSNKDSEYSSVTNLDVARLRLISSYVDRAGNDDVNIGVHDSNLLFRFRKEINLSISEKNALLTAGLRNMEYQNFPFWHWTDGNIERVKSFIQLSLTSDDNSVSASALNIGKIFGYNFREFIKEPHSAVYITKWFDSELDYRLRDAARKYLSKWAEQENVPILEKAREMISGQHAANLDCIIVGIRLRHSETEGLDELQKRNPEQISPELSKVLQSILRDASTTLLEKLTKLKADLIRLYSINELIFRDELRQHVAQELSGDSSIEVRLQAIKYLSGTSVRITEESAREALILRSESRQLGGLFGSQRQVKDTSKFEDYKRYLLKKKSLDDLLAIEQQDSPYEADALLIACKKFPKKTAQMLRSALRDGFESRYDDRLKPIEEMDIPRARELAERTRELKKFCCLKQTSAALNILASQMKKEDLNLVRQVIDRSEIEVSDQILNYFSKFGVWEDLARILNLKPKPPSGLTILGSAYDKSFSLMGRTLAKVGRNRLTELLQKVDDPAIKMALVQASTNAEVADLDDKTLFALFDDKNADVRKVAALRCIKILSKARISWLLDNYFGKQKFYYNVIYWLDLGLTMPRPFVRKIVQSELPSK